MLKNKKNKKKKGFTLIELVIVLAVMAIIALIAIPNFTAIRDNSKKKADARSKEVIERTILMLVSDETISDTGTYVASFADASSSPTVAQQGTATNGGDGIADVGQVQTALKDVKRPQDTSAGDKYKIAITGGTITIIVEK